MRNQDKLLILNENAKSLEDAVNWLKRSQTICTGFNIENLSPEGMDAFEGLTSRFARVCDILFNKLFRSIFYLEEGEAGSWLDVILYMEKENVITSAEDARVMKELRNDIVHEYADNDLTLIFKEVLKQSPLLINYVNNTLEKVIVLKDKIKPTN